MNWEWYADANTMRVFVHCILMANWQDKQWQGKTIKRGSFVTSLGHLSIELKLSVKQVRRALNNLYLTGELGKQTTNKYTLITVTNYDVYQLPGQTKGKQRANKGQQLNKDNNKNNNISNNITKVSKPKNTPLPKNKKDNKEMIDLMGTAFEGLTGQSPVEGNWRQRAWNLLQRVDKRIKEQGATPDNRIRKQVLEEYVRWLNRQDWALSMTKMRVMYEQFETFYAEVVKGTRRGGGNW